MFFQPRCLNVSASRISYLCVVSVLPFKSHTTSSQRLVRANPHSCWTHRLKFCFWYPCGSNTSCWAGAGRGRLQSEYIFTMRPVSNGGKTAVSACGTLWMTQVYGVVSMECKLTHICDVSFGCRSGEAFQAHSACIPLGALTMPYALITMRAPGEATTTRPGQSEAAWKTWQVCLIPQLVFMLLHSFKHDKHIWGPHLVQTEAVWTTPWAYFFLLLLLCWWETSCEPR